MAKEAPKHTPFVRRKYVGMQEENLKTPKCISLLIFWRFEISHNYLKNQTIVQIEQFLDFWKGLEN
jgi:hypothetical protein